MRKLKEEITITDEQLKEVRWLFRQYDLEKPGWLRKKFYINQRRRKTLNEVFFESSLDLFYCGSCEYINHTWSCLLHMMWHQVNGVKLCN